jgi:hypothetical protein
MLQKWLGVSSPFLCRNVRDRERSRARAEDGRIFIELLNGPFLFDQAARQKYRAGLTQAGADLFALSMDRGRLGSGVTHTHPVAPLLPRGERAVTLRQALKKLRIPVLHLDNQPLCVDSASCGTGRPADSVIDSAPARLVRWSNVT